MNQNISIPDTHTKCRSSRKDHLVEYYLDCSIKRPLILDHLVKWNIKFADYKPIEYTSYRVLTDPEKQGAPPVWADPIDPRLIKKWNDIDDVYKADRRSHMGKYDVVNSRPLNPVGRTGLTGRGILGKWGPNHAADPIVTRWKLDESGKVKRNPITNKPILEFVAIQRIDTNEWAIPGGMCDPGEKISQTLKREFYEEAFQALDLELEKREYLEKIYNDFFENGTEVYQGYVDDPRNTDNAWMETIAYNFHDEKRVLDDRYLKAGDDAKRVKWLEIKSNLKLFASHKDFIKRVVDMHDASWSSTTSSDDHDLLGASMNTKSAYDSTTTASFVKSSRSSSSTSARDGNGSSGGSGGESKKKNTSVYVH